MRVATWWLVVLVAVFSPCGAQEYRFLDPDSIDVDVPSMMAHRLELEETTHHPDGSTDLDAWVYVTVDHAQAWGERQLVVNWTALTWNGTGMDVNLAAEPNLVVRARVTPLEVPFGQIVESHYYPDRYNKTAVNPDGEVRRFNTWTDGAVPPGYNEILWPYVLARMNLQEGDRFVLPGISSYSAHPAFFLQLRVTGSVTVQDDEGRTLEGWRVEGIRHPTLPEAQAGAPDAPGRHNVYLVSSEPPYFLGKEQLRFDPDGAAPRVVKRWRLTAWRRLDLTPGRRMDEILRVRSVRGRDQVLPWRR